MILVQMRTHPAVRQHMHTQDAVAVVTVAGRPAGVEEIDVCEQRNDTAWQQLTTRRGGAL